MANKAHSRSRVFYYIVNESGPEDSPLQAAYIGNGKKHPVLGTYGVDWAMHDMKSACIKLSTINGLIYAQAGDYIAKMDNGQLMTFKPWEFKELFAEGDD